MRAYLRMRAPLQFRPLKNCVALQLKRLKTITTFRVNVAVVCMQLHYRFLLLYATYIHRMWVCVRFSTTIGFPVHSPVGLFILICYSLQNMRVSSFTRLSFFLSIFLPLFHFLHSFVGLFVRSFVRCFDFVSFRFVSFGRCCYLSFSIFSSFT